MSRVQFSVTAGSDQEPDWAHVPEAVLKVRSGNCAMTGFVVSDTVTMKVAMESLPLASEAV